MTEATWAHCSKEFSWEGSWRDIYVHGTSIADWDAFVQALPGWGYRTEFLVDEHPRGLPATAKPIFDERAEASPLLRLHIGPVVVQCHFFTEAEMEFDLDPREVRGSLEFQGILAFMQKLAVLVGRQVTLTPENGPEYPVISVDPCAGRPEYHG